MAGNILTRDRANADLDIAAKEIAGVKYPRNMLVDASGVDITPATQQTLESLLAAVQAQQTGLTDTELRAAPLSVTGTFYQATQPVSFTWSGLTDAQLRASPVPVSFTQTGLTDAELRATPVSVSGTFWQATQPVSFAWDGLTDAQLRATAVPVSMASAPTGAALEAGNIATILARTPVLGAAALSASSPVNLSNDTVVGASAASVVNTDLLTGTVSGWYDAAAAHSVSIQVIGSAGISAGQIFFEQTNDTALAPNGNVWAVDEITGLTPTPQIAALAIAANTTRMFGAPVMARYVRVRISTAFVGGTVQAVAAFSQLPYQRQVQTVHQATAANLNVTASGTVTATVTGGTVNPVVPATPYILNSAATTNGALILTGTSGLQAFYATNTGATAAFVKLYNKATAPTVGTDVPAMILYVPAAVSGVPGVCTLPIGFSGFRFALGLGIAITGAVGDSDTTAVAAGQVKVILSRTV